MADSEDSHIDIAHALIREGPDIFCHYAFGSSMTDLDSVRSTMTKPLSAPHPRIRAWLDASRALALDLTLANRLPAFGRAGGLHCINWGVEGNGRVDLQEAAKAIAIGMPKGLPWIEHRRSTPGAEVIALRDALHSSIRALNSNFVPRFMMESARSSSVRLRRFRSQIESRWPGLGPPNDPRISSIRFLQSRKSEDLRQDFDLHAKIARLFSRTWNFGLFTDTDTLEISTLGGKRFADRALELLLLSRLRVWLTDADPKGRWHHERVRAAENKPLYEGVLEGQPIKLWYQSSRALPPLVSENQGSRTFLGRTIPDIVLKLGHEEQESILVIDAKNYVTQSGLGAESRQIMGDMGMRGIINKRVLIVRASAVEHEEREEAPDHRWILSFLDMTLAPQGMHTLGNIANRMLRKNFPVV